MTEQEYQEKILNLEQEIINLKSTITTHETNETTLKTEKENLTNDNNKLKEHNLSLFLKLTDQEKINNDPDKNKGKTNPPKNENTIEDITNKMLTKEE